MRGIKTYWMKKLRRIWWDDEAFSTLLPADDDKSRDISYPH